MNAMPTKHQALLDLVEVPALLKDIPGGDVNLLPVTAMGQALSVVVPMWPVSDPRPGEPERLTLFWDTIPVKDKQWEAPVQPEDLELSVPVANLTAGPHELRYEVTNAAGDMSPSATLTVLIDLTPPALGGAQGMLTVLEDPEEIERDGLTERYLRNHGQRLRTQVPGYTTPVAGDTVILYWDAEPFAETWAGEYEIAFEEVGGPFYVDFTTELIVQRGDGDRYLYYAIKDRAGNLSAFSKPLKLPVSAATRTFPWPSIAQATGTEGQLRLALDDLRLPLLVQVPAEAVVYPDEKLRVEWGQPGDPGYFCATTGYAGREREFEIPEQKIAAQGGTTIKVKFVASGEKRLDYPSPPVELSILALSKNLPRVGLAGVASGIFKLSQAPAAVPVTLGTWRLMAEGQLVDIWVTGVLKDGEEAAPHQVLKDYVVKPTDLSGGIGLDNDVVLAKSFLDTLLMDNPFTLRVQVRFAPLGVPVNFPVLSPTLQP